MQFRILLKELLEEMNLSNNILIERTGINRSTFYQFLNGKRLPTVQQFSQIMKAASFPEEDARKLRQQFAYEKLGEEDNQCLEMMQGFMATIAEIEADEEEYFSLQFRQENSYDAQHFYSTPEKVKQAVIHFLQREIGTLNDNNFRGGYSRKDRWIYFFRRN